MTLSNEAFEVVDAVHEHWVLQGVQDAADMRDELADHLGAALRDGKTIEDVTGPDLQAFADQWAAERSRDSVRWKWGAVAGAIMFAAATRVALAMVGERSLEVRIDLGGLVIVAGITAAALFLFRGRLTSAARPRSRRRTLLRDASVLVGAAVALSVAFRLMGRPQLHLPAWISVLAVAPLAVLVTGLLAADLPDARRLLGLGDREIHRAELRRRLVDADEFEFPWKSSG